MDSICKIYIISTKQKFLFTITFVKLHALHGRQFLKAACLIV